MQNEMVMRGWIALLRVPMRQALARRMVIDSKCSWGNSEGNAGRDPRARGALDKQAFRNEREN